MQARDVQAFHRSPVAPRPGLPGPFSADPAALDRLAGGLAAAELPFRLVDHGGRSARAVAEDLGLSAAAQLSVSLLRCARGDWLAVAQVTRLLDLAAAARAVGEPALTIAGPDEIRARFGPVDTESLCPLATGPGLRHLLDRPVAGLRWAMCPAGDGGWSLLFEPGVLVELTWPVVAEVTVAPPSG